MKLDRTCLGVAGAKWQTSAKTYRSQISEEENKKRKGKKRELVLSYSHIPSPILSKDGLFACA